jgi:hypothetical protein
METVFAIGSEYCKTLLDLIVANVRLKMRLISGSTFAKVVQFIVASSATLDENALKTRPTFSGDLGGSH